MKRCCIIITYTPHSYLFTCITPGSRLRAINHPVQHSPQPTAHLRSIPEARSFNSRNPHAYPWTHPHTHILDMDVCMSEERLCNVCVCVVLDYVTLTSSGRPSPVTFHLLQHQTRRVNSTAEMGLCKKLPDYTMLQSMFNERRSIRLCCY